MRPFQDINKLGLPVKIATDDIRVLILGQSRAEGIKNPVANPLVEDVQSVSQAGEYFGRLSDIYQKFRAFRKINPTTRVDIGLLPDPVPGDNASFSIYFDGTGSDTGFTKNQTFQFSFADADLFTYSINILKGQTLTEVYNKIIAVVNSDVNRCVTATLDTTTDPLIPRVNVEYRNSGTLYNNYPVLHSNLSESPAYLSAFSTATTGGTGEPSQSDYDKILNRIATTRYQFIVWGSSYDRSVISDFLSARWEPKRDKYLTGWGLFASANASASTLASEVAGYNEPWMVHGFQKLVDTQSYKGPGLNLSTTLMSVRMAALLSLKLTTSANLNSISVGRVEPLDLFGGIRQATRPFHNTPLLGLPKIKEGNQFTDNEIDNIISKGGYTFVQNLNNSGMVLSTVPTTYKTDALGGSDDTYKFLNTAVAEDIFINYLYRQAQFNYAQVRLSTSNTGSAGTITVNQIKADLTEQYNFLADNEIVERDGLQEFLSSLAITLNKRDGEVVIDVVANLVGQLRKIFWNVGITLN